VIYSKVAEGSLLTFKFSDMDSSKFYIFGTFLHFGVKRKFQHIFQELFFPCIILTLYIQEGIVFISAHCQYVTWGIRFHSYTPLSPKWSVSSVCLLNPIHFYETQEFSVRKISCIKVVNLCMKK